MLLAIWSIVGTISCTRVIKEQDTRMDLALIPYPDKVLKRSGFVSLDHNFWVIADVSDTSMAELGKYLVERIDRIPGAVGSIADLYSTRNHEQGISIELINDPNMHPQGYILTITSRIIQIQATHTEGIFYGIQSILDIISNSWDKSLRTAVIRQMVITDQPNTQSRVARITELNDSTDFANLEDLVSSYKYSHLWLEADAENPFQNDVTKKYLQVINVIEQPGTSEINLDSSMSEIEPWFLNTAAMTADTVVVSFTASNSGELARKMAIGAQLLWGGPGEKSLSRVKDKLENKQSTID
jgi:hypothetical protein